MVHGIYVDLTGLKFGLLTVVEDKRGQGKNPKCECKCDCGNVGLHYKNGLKNGRTKSCGCRKRDNTTHGLSDSQLYGWWAAYKDDCVWGSFEEVLEEVGFSDCWLYRLDRGLPFGPGNWQFEEINYRKIGRALDIGGVVKSVAGWGVFLGLSRQRAHQLWLNGDLVRRVELRIVEKEGL